MHAVQCNCFIWNKFNTIASININLDELDHSTRAKSRVRTFPPCYHLGSGLFGSGHLRNHCIYTSRKSVRRESYLPDEHKVLAHVCRKKSHAATSHMSTPKDQTSDLVELTPSKRLSGLIHSTGSLASPTFEHCNKILIF